MGLIVNFSDFENKTGNTLSASDYLVGFTSDPDREIKISINDFISYIESSSANDLYTILNQNSGKWDSVYISVSPNSGYWNSVYTTVNTVSSSWTTGGTSLLTVLNYLSSNLVLLSAANVTQNVVVSGNVTIFGNLTALGNTTFTNVNYVTSVSASFNELFVSSLTATNITNNKLNSTYTTLNQNSSVGGSVYTTLNQNSAKYDSTYTTLNQNSSVGGSVYTTVNNNSAFWSRAYTNLVTNSAAYLLSGSNTVLGNIPNVSANWDNTYTQYSQNSANYAIGSFLSLSGGTMFGLLSTVDGIGTASLSSRSIDLIHLPANDGTNPVLRIGEYDVTTGQGFSGAFISYDEINNILGLSAVFGANTPINAISINRNGFVGVATNSPDSELTVVGTTFIEKIKEKVTLSAFNPQGTLNFDLKTQSLLFFTLSSQGSWTLNFRGDTTTTLNNIMSAGQSFTCVAIVSTGTTVYYNSAVQIDGTTYTPYYLNGLTPQAVVSNTRALQNYAYTIIKRGNAVFNVLASVNEYY